MADKMQPLPAVAQSKASFKSQISHEDSVVPALGMKQPIDFNTVEDKVQKEDVSASQE